MTTRALLVASFPDSVLDFRGPLIRALQQRGVEVHLAVPDVPAGSTLRTALEGEGIVVHGIDLRRTGMNPLADARCLLQLWWLMRRLRPELLLGYTIKPVVYGSIAGWAARVPRRYALITGLGYAFTGDGADARARMRGLAQRLYRIALRRVHAVFFQNPDDQALFSECGLLAPGVRTLVVNGSGIDLDAFPQRALPPGPPHFLMISRLLGDKGVREYAAAARQVRAGYPDMRFGLVGWIDGNPDAIAPQELATWQADGTIEFLGRMPDVRAALADCTVYVLPSYREGTPRTVLEAMATGRAVITTDAPGCRGTVVDGENGFLVPVRSASALVQAMLRFIEQPQLAAAMGQRSRDMAREIFDVHRVNDILLAEMGLHAPGTDATLMQAMDMENAHG